ncbi:unnamed protein product [Ostreobium quekettii]|uniref:Ferredoxin--nitrite reductase, chloroplastic n=1 Tax=Ostreobium quekettii TaxID=121088 RepID=A0A8S1IYR1_9CHLO|nr:unnamed protein product [Ostreobium quekettii]|eukprot:evm.model.scf_1637.3 EVM.evm.TU.scf_1637.3   scf_1637:29572-34745(-)
MGRRLACQAAVESPSEVDLETSGLRHLPQAARDRALAKNANKFEKVKVAKCGSRMWTEIPELAELIRRGETKWEDLELDDIDIRMKWAGLFHRRKRHPGTFMMRLKVPNGELTSAQLRGLGEVVLPYGADGCGDITTRANIQLRGITMAEADRAIDAVQAIGLTSYQTGMDNVRNITGNPIAGLDPHELVDTRPICQEIQDMIVNGGKGNPELVNLPRKLNICVSSTRDDFPHTHINDVGLEAVVEPGSGEVVYNVVIGGYFSVKRNAVSFPIDTSVTREQVTPFCEAVLKVFRDHGERANRQKTRLIWMVEALGIEKFRDLVGEYMGGVQLARSVPVSHAERWERRDLIGVHPQKQAGLCFVGACVPAGRIPTADFFEMADVAERWGDGTVRLTCEENVIFVNVPEGNVEGLLAEPLLQRYRPDAGLLERGLVSCTGSQFCGLALIETKNRAMRLVEALEAELDIPKTVRIHWTGCPNSCGQAQVADIGLMGAPAKLDGKAVEGVKIFLGGKIGEGAELAQEFEAGIPAQEEYLLPKLREILIEKFGATPKASNGAGPGQLGEGEASWWGNLAGKFVATPKASNGAEPGKPGDREGAWWRTSD